MTWIDPIGGLRLFVRVGLPLLLVLLAVDAWVMIPDVQRTWHQMVAAWRDVSEVPGVLLAEVRRIFDVASTSLEYKP